jgi:hypothetical protein
MADFEKSTVPKAPDLQKRLEAALPGRTIVFACGWRIRNYGDFWWFFPASDVSIKK